MNPNIVSYKDIVLGLAKQLNAGNIYEIGVGEQATTAEYLLLNYWDKHFHLYMIDVEKHKLAQEKLSAFNFSRYTFIHGSSQNPAVYERLPKMDIILVDGDHSFDGVYNDIAICREFDLLNKGGLITFHDSNAKQIKEALEVSTRDFGLEYFNVENSNFAIGRFK
jgi:methyltransferase family protein